MLHYYCKYVILSSTYERHFYLNKGVIIPMYNFIILLVMSYVLMVFETLVIDGV